MDEARRPTTGVGMARRLQICSGSTLSGTGLRAGLMACRALPILLHPAQPEVDRFQARVFHVADSTSLKKGEKR